MIDLDKIPKAQLKISVEKELSQRSLYQFFCLCVENVYKHIEFIPNWHYKAILDIIDAEICRMLRGEKTQKHLLINVPIRSGKTIMISEIVPIWIWIKSGGKYQVMSICSTQRLASKSSRMSKLILTSQWFTNMFPEIVLSQDNKSKSDYSTTNGGTRMSFGIDSSIIGQGFDVLIIDDPNDPADSNSDIAIRNVVETYRDVIAGRANSDRALKIILQQRTSERDLCGELLQNNKNEFRHLCIPAVLSKDTSPEFIQYYKDGLFFPDRYSRERLSQYSKDLSPSAYASQLLQAPAALEGTTLKRIWFKSIKESDFIGINQGKHFLFLDTAFGENKDNDPSCLYLCTEIGGNLYLIRTENFWLEFHDLTEKIMEWIKVYNVKKVYVENKATGISIMQELKRQLRGFVPILPINPGSKSKVERAQAIQNYLVNGKVVLVEGFWNNEFLNQCSNFPYARHDDMVDCLVYSVLTLLTKGWKSGKVTPDNTITDSRGMIEYDADEGLSDLYK